MLLGEMPEPADDIYSLAVVIYLMLTGRHPYDRVRADEAATQGLRPERVKRLTRRQWRTLARALELERSNRPQSMDEVIAGLLRPPLARAWWVAGFAAAVAIGAVALWLGTSAVDRSEVARDTLLRRQVARIDALLAEPVYDASWQAAPRCRNASARRRSTARMMRMRRRRRAYSRRCAAGSNRRPNSTRHMRCCSTPIRARAIVSNRGTRCSSGAPPRVCANSRGPSASNANGSTKSRRSWRASSARFRAARCARNWSSNSARRISRPSADWSPRAMRRAPID